MKKNAILILIMLFLTTACASNSDDMFEGYNRKMTSFNQEVDRYVLKPVAEGYIAITTKGIRKSVTSILGNIWEPFSAVNYLLQGDLQGASLSLSRFTVNSTVGLLGAFDVAKEIGLEKDRTGFDETLAYWCVPDGPFIVLPFLGPSTPRTMAASVVNNVANPVVIASHSIDSEGTQNSVVYGYEGLRLVNARANAMPFLNDLERNSVDYYTALKTGFLQNRSKVKCFLNKDEITYDFDFDVEGY